MAKKQKQDNKPVDQVGTAVDTTPLNINLNWAQLSEEVRLFISMPMYGGMVNGTTAANVMDFAILCARRNIHIATHFQYNESLITRARNYAADEFLRSDCTHMIFIDADINFNPIDLIAMIQLQLNSPGKYNVLCAPYTKKAIAWEKVLAAANAGAGDQDPNNLENFTGDFVINFLPDTDTMYLFQPTQVLESGTGFMLIERATFEKFKEAHPGFSYKPDHVRMKNFDGSREIHGYFLDPIDPESKRHLSEDYFFCQYVRKAGMTVWICPWVPLNHVGSYVYKGNMPALASVSAHLTADHTKISQR